jgi:hypothetical protein
MRFVLNFRLVHFLVSFVLEFDVGEFKTNTFKKTD